MARLRAAAGKLAQVKLEVARPTAGDILPIRAQAAGRIEIPIPRRWCFQKPARRSEKIGPRTPRARLLQRRCRWSDSCTIATFWKSRRSIRKQGVQFYVLVKTAEPAFAPSQRLSALSSGRGDTRHPGTAGQFGPSCLASPVRTRQRLRMTRSSHSARAGRWGRMVRHWHNRIADALGEQHQPGGSGPLRRPVCAADSKSHQPQ